MRCIVEVRRRVGRRLRDLLNQNEVRLVFDPSKCEVIIPTRMIGPRAACTRAGPRSDMVIEVVGKVLHLIWRGTIQKL